MAGNSLTTGAFLAYFANDLGASATTLAWIAAGPELVGSSGLLARRVWRSCGSRKAVWIGVTLLARGLTLLIPFAGSPYAAIEGFGGPERLLAIVLLSQFFQGIATSLYFAWLSDLVPPEGWGRLFAGRNIAGLLIQMTVPVAGAWLRDSWKQNLPHERLWQAYAVVFTIGVGLLLLSMPPLLAVPDPYPHGSRAGAASISRSPWGSRPLRRLMAHAWCLALANGLTQAAFFQYQIGIVQLSLTGYQLLATLMYGGQIVWSAACGRATTPREHRGWLFVGALIASGALPCWLLASAEQWWWLIGAFLCWGAFGAVNVAGPNLLLGHCVPGETVRQLAWFRQTSGTIAGLSGLLGGWLLDQGCVVVAAWGWSKQPVFAALFTLSWLGRLLAAWLVLRVPVPADQSAREAPGP